MKRINKALCKKIEYEICNKFLSFRGNRYYSKQFRDKEIIDNCIRIFTDVDKLKFIIKGNELGIPPVSLLELFLINILPKYKILVRKDSVKSNYLGALVGFVFNIVGIKCKKSRKYCQQILAKTGSRFK